MQFGSKETNVNHAIYHFVWILDSFASVHYIKNKDGRNYTRELTEHIVTVMTNVVDKYHSLLEPVWHRCRNATPRAFSKVTLRQRPFVAASLDRLQDFAYNYHGVLNVT